MFSGRPSHASTSPPLQHGSSQGFGFAAFASHADGFKATAETKRLGGFSFSSAASTRVPASRGGGFLLDRAVPPTSLFGPSTSGRGGFASKADTPFGPQRTTTNVATPFGPSTSGSDSASGSRPTSNPLGRGLTTRECFAVNDDQRFAKPAFQSTPKRSAWAVIASLSQHTPARTDPAIPVPRSTSLFGASSRSVGFGFSGPTTTTSFGGTSTATTTTTWGDSGSTAYAPTQAVELYGHSTGQLMSISGMPLHANQSVEELRFSAVGSCDKPSPWTFGLNTSASSGGSIRFGVDPPSALSVIGEGAEFLGGATTFAFQTQTPHGKSGNPFARIGVSSADKAASPPWSGFGLGTATPTPAALPVNPFATTHSSLNSDVAASPSPWGFDRPTEPPSTTAKLSFGKNQKAASTRAGGGGFRFGFKEASTAHTPPAPAFSFPNVAGGRAEPSTSIPKFKFSLPTVSSQFHETVNADPSPGESKPVEDEVASTTEKADENLSLALPPLTPSYATISGSRATAFLRRAGVGRSKGFTTQSYCMVVAATPSPRKFSKEFPSQPTSKPIERIVVGRRDAELWKRSVSPLRTSLLANSAHAAATAFASTAIPKGDQKSTALDDDEHKNDEYVEMPTAAAEAAIVNLDEYDL